MNSGQRYVRIALTGPLRRTFTYHWPPALGEPFPGQRVLVPFGRVRRVGFHLGDSDIPAGFKTRAVADALDAQTYFPADLFKLCLWMADYYFANPADCLSAALPGVFKSRRTIRYRWASVPAPDLPPSVAPRFTPGERLSASQVHAIQAVGCDYLERLLHDGIVLEESGAGGGVSTGALEGYRAAGEQGWVEFFQGRKLALQPFEGTLSVGQLKAEGWTDHYIRQAARHGLLVPVRAEPADAILQFIAPRPGVANLTLTEEQQAAVSSVSHALGNGFQPFLLHGVTGSGKTLVYCHLARQVLKMGLTVLVLTPEISLSGLTLAYLRSFFGSDVTVLHSAMTERERLESWRGIRHGKYRIVIGPRSAVFAPLEKLGLIVVDEEHDSSYKQDDPAPRFHGRDAAIMRAKISNVPVLLGSASPSLESYHHAETGRYRRLILSGRPGKATLPGVEIIDMRVHQVRGDLPFLSLPLKRNVEQRLKNGEQVILYLNRRGYSPQLKCGDCGHVAKCPRCCVSLTYHKVGRKLSCHYCGHVRLGYDSCEACSSTRFLYLGTGTQKVEESIPRVFEGASAVRFDSDTASGRKNAYRILEAFAAGEHNLLLGTQMVTKGLDLTGVSLVGVLSADHGLDLPDFRASEKTFARLLQVAGRSGRAARPGEVLIQTFYPDEETISDAARQDYRAFYSREIEARRRSVFPPFCRLVNFSLSGSDERKVETSCHDLRGELERRTSELGVKAQFLGPAPCPLYRLRGQYRRHLLVKTGQLVRFVRMLGDWEARQPRFGLPSTVKVTVDVDPDDMM
ncbi:MAG TPA: primosomal protein N' [Acidobacteriota bacterium]|nr:primosomal protein N' [Acidobacteriota bacterium]